MHQADTKGTVDGEGKRNSHLMREGKTQAGEVSSVMLGQSGRALMLKGHDTVPATSVRRTCMRLRTIETQHVAGLGEP